MRDKRRMKNYWKTRCRYYVDTLCCWIGIFAGVTSILAKSGIKKTDSNVATAIRTIVVFIFSWIMVFVVGSQASIKMVGQKTLLF